MHFSTILGSAATLSGLAYAAPTELLSRDVAMAGLNTNSAKTMVNGNGPNKWNIQNKSGKAIKIVTWGPVGSWVNKIAPDVNQDLAKDANITLTTPNGYSGAMAAIYGSETQLVNGQISNTWLEFTTGAYGVINISREPNSKGNKISATLHSHDGKQCTADFNRCYFACTDTNQPSCMNPYPSDPKGYQLYHCGKGSAGYIPGQDDQPGAQWGRAKYGSAPEGDSGGCGGFSAAGATVDVVFS